MKTLLLIISLFVLCGCKHRQKIDVKVSTESAPKPKVTHTISETTRVVRQVPVYQPVVEQGPTITKTVDENGKTVNDAPLHSAVPASPLAKTPAVNFRSDLDTTGK